MSEPRPLGALARLGGFFLVAIVAGAVAAAMILPVAAATGLRVWSTRIHLLWLLGAGAVLGGLGWV